MISTSGPSISARRRSMSQPPMTATALVLRPMRQRPLVLCPLMMAMCQRRARLPAGWTSAVGGGWVSGRSAITASRSPRVLASRASPTRSENSSSVSRPSTTCSRRSVTVRSRSASATRSLRAPPGVAGRCSSGTGKSAMAQVCPLPAVRVGPDGPSGHPAGSKLGSSAVRGILSAAGYVPYRRLARADISSFMGSGGGKGTRAVASHDEDTTTLGVEAARLALRSAPGQVPDALWFATSQPAYLDKTNATAVAAALRLPGDVGRLRLRRRAALGHGLPRDRAPGRRDHPRRGRGHARRAADERGRVLGG